MTVSSPSNLLGRIGEECVVGFIKKRHGWNVIGRNVRLHVGEIDIVAKDQKTVIFIEVKAGRKGSDDLRPEQHLDFHKARKLRAVCCEYLLANRYPDGTDWRIDLAAVAVGEGGEAIVRYYANVVGE